jgi:hypothetical protein
MFLPYLVLLVLKPKESMFWLHFLGEPVENKE